MSPRKLVTGFLTAALLAGTAVTLTPASGWAQQPPAAATPDQPGPGPRGPHRERPMPGRHIEGRLAFLKTELKITPAQQPQWERVEAVMRSNANEMRQTAEQMRGQPGQPGQPGQAPGAADRMERQAQMAEQRATHAKAFAAAFRPLYDSLTPEQKKSADELFARPMRHGGRH